MPKLASKKKTRGKARFVISQVLCLEREFFFDNLLIRIQLIIQMILADRPCAMGF
jgi:hypothetical protein